MFLYTSAGFHTFDYARHFLSCCSRMLGVEHVTSRGEHAVLSRGLLRWVVMTGDSVTCQRKPPMYNAAVHISCGIVVQWADMLAAQWPLSCAGAIMLEYYGRNVGIKIMPTGVNCDRLLAGLTWNETIWRRGELQVPPPWGSRTPSKEFAAGTRRARGGGGGGTFTTRDYACIGGLLREQHDSKLKQ